MEIDELKDNNKKKLFFLALTIILCLGITFGAVYFIYTFNDSRENTIDSGLISIDYTEGSENILITNAVPVIDEVGLTNTPYTFTVTNTSSIPINIRIQVVPDANNTIPLGALRFGLYVEDELIELNNISTLEDNTLYVLENFQVNQSINCKLVFWVDYYYDTPNQVFSAKIKVTGESFDIIVENTTT